MARLLAAAGYETAAFSSAEELLLSQQAEAADCVVSDIQLPAMSGFDLIDRLRRSRGQLPTVFVTAFDSAGAREKAKVRDAVYLAKPFEGADLLQAIVRATSGAFRTASP